MINAIGCISMVGVLGVMACFLGLQIYCNYKEAIKGGQDD